MQPNSSKTQEILTIQFFHTKSLHKVCVDSNISTSSAYLASAKGKKPNNSSEYTSEQQYACKKKSTIERGELFVGDAVALVIGDGSVTPQKKINASITSLNIILTDTHPAHLALEDFAHSWQMLHVKFRTQHTGTLTVDVLIT
jgi:hypothetical protein